jgi:hypothetical protein
MKKMKINTLVITSRYSVCTTNPYRHSFIISGHSISFLPTNISESIGVICTGADVIDSEVFKTFQLPK